MNRREFVKLSQAFPVAAVTASLTLREEGKPDVEGLDVSVLRVQPGDIVVLSVPGCISSHTAERIKAQWESLCPGTRAAVLGDGMKIDGVLRGPTA